MSTKLINWLLLIALALIWGSSFILMKRGLDVYSSDEVAALRIFIAFLFLSPLLFRHFKLVHFKKWAPLLGMGMFGNFIPAFLFTKAETGISSSLAGMLNSLTPLFTMVLGILLFKTKTKWVNALGILIGFAGAVGLLMIGGKDDTNTNPLFGFYAMLATIFYALSVNIIKKSLNEMNSITATVLALSFIGPIAGVYLFGFTEFTHHFETNTAALSSLGFVSILAIFGTAISVILFNLLVRNTNALFASSVTYLIPIVAISWGMFDNERINAKHLMCIAVILVSVYLVNKKSKLAPTSA